MSVREGLRTIYSMKKSLVFDICDRAGTLKLVLSLRMRAVGVVSQFFLVHDVK